LSRSKSSELTSLEELMVDALKSRGVVFRAQVPTRSGFVLDFLIGDHLVIETDGPCHDGSKNKKRDRARDRILKIGGYKVCRIGYKMMNDQEKFNAWLDKVIGSAP